MANMFGFSPIPTIELTCRIAYTEKEGQRATRVG